MPLFIVMRRHFSCADYCRSYMMLDAICHAVVYAAAANAYAIAAAGCLRCHDDAADAAPLLPAPRLFITTLPLTRHMLRAILCLRCLRYYIIGAG